MPSSGGFRILDGFGLVCGFALAALLARSVVPELDRQETFVLVPAGVVYAWLGFAMAGPPVLLARLLRNPAAPWTWAESAWLLIGAYWLAVAVLVAPRGLPNSAWLGVFPILAVVLAAALRNGRRKPTQPPTPPPPPDPRRVQIDRPKPNTPDPNPDPDPETDPRPRDSHPRPWTHSLAVALLVTWPAVWLCLVVVTLART